ncbi:MAG: hypothetical protein IH988_05440 [Planctomycetes bacterium]|nr:hypothetical protein [Planctomycetota bacterium]
MLLDAREKVLLIQYQCELRMLANRDVLGKPLRADEIMVTIPRDKYRELLCLGVETLIDRAVH